MKRTAYLLIVLIPLVVAGQNRSNEPIPAMPKLLTQREQMNVRDAWLKKRFDTVLLPMMRKHGIDMWIVVNEEFHNDPVIEHVVPPIPIVGRRDIFVFVERNGKLEKYAVVRYLEEALKRHFTLISPPRGETGSTLKKLVDERDPKTIALNMGGSRGQQSGLTHDGYKFLAESLGASNEKKFVSSGSLLTEYLDTRLPEELEHYRTAVFVTDVITRRAFSNAVIKPGTTTVGDVRWWMIQQVNDLGLGIWFTPDLRVQRQATTTTTTQQFVDVAPESTVLQRGDVIHVDFGVVYMGLSTDWQKHGYILKSGERDAPAGLKTALRNTNRLQDILIGVARSGMTGSEVYEKSMAECKAQGINCMIYSHPVGTHGHALGPSIDFRGAIGGGGLKILPGSYMSIELNTSTDVPEWNNQRVTIMAEDDAHMTDSGYKWFRPRQTEFYLIK